LEPFLNIKLKNAVWASGFTAKKGDRKKLAESLKVEGKSIFTGFEK